MSELLKNSIGDVYFFIECFIHKITRENEAYQKANKT